MASAERPGRHADRFSPIDACPACGDRDFLCEEDDGVAVFRCLGCAAGWRYELGYVWQIHERAPVDTESVDRGPPHP